MKDDHTCKFCGKSVNIAEGLEPIKHGDSLLIGYCCTRDGDRFLYHHTQCAMDAGDYPVRMSAESPSNLIISAPRDGQNLLLWDGDNWIMGFWHQDHGWYGDHHSARLGSFINDRPITHWLPMPPNPTV